VFWSYVFGRDGPASAAPVHLYLLLCSAQFRGLLRPIRKGKANSLNVEPIDGHQSAAPASHPQLVPARYWLSQTFHPSLVRGSRINPPRALPSNAMRPFVNREPHPDRGPSDSGLRCRYPLRDRSTDSLQSLAGSGPRLALAQQTRPAAGGRGQIPPSQLDLIVGKLTSQGFGRLGTRAASGRLETRAWIGRFLICLVSMVLSDKEKNSEIHPRDAHLRVDQRKLSLLRGLENACAWERQGFSTKQSSWLAWLNGALRRSTKNQACGSNFTQSLLSSSSSAVSWPLEMILNSKVSCLKAKFRLKEYSLKSATSKVDRSTESRYKGQTWAKNP